MRDPILPGVSLATQDEMELPKVCENKVTVTMRVIPALTILALPFFGLWYTKVELWGPITKRVPQFSLRKMPRLLKPVDRIDFWTIEIGIN